MTEQAQSGSPALVRPPRLRTGQPAEASRLELFFDLAYVLVVIELGKSFYSDLTWHGLAVVVGLFVVVWVSWVGFTLYANRFDTDDVVFRLAKLAATAAIAGCAAAASGAVGKYAVPFAVCFLVGRVLLLLLYLRAWRHVPEGSATIRVYLVALGISSTLWAVSVVVPEPTRYALWALAVLIDGLGPVLATLRNDRLPLHVEHLPERFGLLIILVLGEALGGAARGIHDAGWAVPAVAVGGAAVVFTAAMWWVYFDIAATTGADNLDQDSPGTSAQHPRGGDSGASDARHDMFVYGHLPMAPGTLVGGVGLEDLVVNGDTGAEWVLAGGLALFLFGIALVNWRDHPTVELGLAVAPGVHRRPTLDCARPAAERVDLHLVGCAVLIVLAIHGTVARRTSATALYNS